MNKDAQPKEFFEALLAIKQEASCQLSSKDRRHLMLIIWINRLLLVIGYGTAWIMPNILSMLCISIAMHGQWTIVAHHVSHGGYDNVPNMPARYHSKRFAFGWRRLVDWLDWMYPPAWAYEHNVLHHFYTNEVIDPDYLALKVKQYVNPQWPKWLTFCFVCINITAWKASYYSMNTLKAYTEKKAYNYATIPTTYARKSFIYNFIPYLGIYFIFIPLLFLPMGWLAVFYVFINRLGAEILTNIHSFLTIVPNHVGDDISFRPEHFKTRNEFYINQIEGAVNYHTGSFLGDYLQGYLNYQIEHHLFPDLPPYQYVKMQPKIKKLCEQYHIHYKQESIFGRIRKTFGIIMRG
jgi:fatty acid desaturase